MQSSIGTQRPMPAHAEKSTAEVVSPNFALQTDVWFKRLLAYLYAATMIHPLLTGVDRSCSVLWIAWSRCAIGYSCSISGLDRL